MGNVNILAVLALHICAKALPTGASPFNERATETSLATSSTASAILNGQTFINKGLVAFGLIPSNFRESTGDTMGGIGSAIAIEHGTWKETGGKFEGTLVVHPDRGFNVISTVDYRARQFNLDFVLTPYYGTTNLSFTAAQETLALTYKKTILQFDRFGGNTSGLDALAVRPAVFGFPLDPFADPQMPIASEAERHLTIDAEGIVSNADGTFWVSDEYGPFIYRFSANGQLIQTIEPPEAFLPLDAAGNLNFTSETNPVTGRQGNQGFEGLSLDSSTGTLYALLQSATIQDGGSSKSTSRYTRLVAYDVSDVLIRPRLVGEWVVPLPQDSKGKTLASSEVHFVSKGVFLTLARDANGRGGSSDSSSYKQADLFDISTATDIHGTKFDDPSNPIAVGGVLDSSITPANYVPFVNYLDATQLARFGLHNGDPDDQTLLDAKWESLALAPVNDPQFPNDYFLFTASDNDFLSTQGFFDGVPFNAGEDVDNQFMVFRLTLPSVPKGSICRELGVAC